jgi:ketosteroid isomerase-like protein
VEALSAMKGQATFFDPGGGFTEGAAEASAVNLKGAQSFGSKGKSQFDIKDSRSSANLAFWTGFQNAEVEMAESGDIKQMKIRVTEIFRLIDGEWRMIHRHASMAKD